jgi:hypothetical protein
MSDGFESDPEKRAVFFDRDSEGFLPCCRKVMESREVFGGEGDGVDADFRLLDPFEERWQVESLHSVHPDPSELHGPFTEGSGDADGEQGSEVLEDPLFLGAVRADAFEAGARFRYHVYSTGRSVEEVNGFRRWAQECGIISALCKRNSPS